MLYRYHRWMTCMSEVETVLKSSTAQATFGVLCNSGAPQMASQRQVANCANTCLYQKCHGE